MADARPIDPLRTHLEQKLRQHYVQSRDDRQAEMGLSYMTAETGDLARMVTMWVRLYQMDNIRKVLGQP